MDRGARLSSCSECDADRLGSVSFYSPFLSQFWIASRLVCSLCEAIAGSLSVASTAVPSAKVAVVEFGEVGRYNNGPRTLPWSTPALTGESSVYPVSTVAKKCLLCK
jgi:hypothetical protein